MTEVLASKPLSATPFAPAGTAFAPTWRAFEQRLVAVLGRMVNDQYVILSTRDRGDDTSHHFVQFAQGNRTGFLAEAVSNHYLKGTMRLSPDDEEAMAGLRWQFPDPRSRTEHNFSREWPMPVPFADVARLAIRTLREVYRVASPADLTYRSFSREGGEFSEPDLGIDQEPRPERKRQEPDPEATAAALRARLEDILQATFGKDVVADASGKYTISFDGHELFVAPLPWARPIVRVFAIVARGVPHVPGLQEALNILNTEIVFTRMLYINDQVIAAGEVRGENLNADELAAVGGTVAWVADQARERLAAFIGGPAAAGGLVN